MFTESCCRLLPLKTVHNAIPRSLSLLFLPVFRVVFCLQTVPVVWCHLMPFAPTEQHAPPVGFGDGQTFFSWTARLKWKLAGSVGYDMM